MDDTEKIYVSKDAIYIQILDYEKREANNFKQELFFLTNIITSFFEVEYTKMLQKQRVEMTVLEIKRHFKPYNYYPKSSFIQYIPLEEEII